jgi:hypothetical protein
MAIGALILNWAQWDGDLTQHVFRLRDKVAARRIDVSRHKVLYLHKERLRTLRRLIIALTSDPSDELRVYDTIVGRVAPLTELRGSVAHSLIGLANPAGTLDDLRLSLFSPRFVDSLGELSRGGPLEMPVVWDVFAAADTLWDEREKLDRLVAGMDRK